MVGRSREGCRGVKSDREVPEKVTRGKVRQRQRIRIKGWRVSDVKRETGGGV